jgi:rod shape-determining protein MreD
MMDRNYGNDGVPLGRIALLALSLVVVDAFFLRQLRILGVRPLPFLLLTVISALELGSYSGTLAGFIFGLTADLFGTGRIGIWALVFCLLGFCVGFARDHAFPAARERLPLLLIVGSSWIGVLSYVGISYLVDEAPVPKLTRIAVALALVAGWNVILGLPMRMFVRRVFGESVS